MSGYSLFCFLVLVLVQESVHGIEYDDIVRITTITGEEQDAGMDVTAGSSIDVEVFGHYGGSECRIFDMRHSEENGEGDYSPGQRDEFVGADLQSCEGHTVIWYPGSVSKIRVYHFGSDDWGVGQVLVHFDDLSVISCGTAGETVFVTDREFVDLICL